MISSKHKFQEIFSNKLLLHLSAAIVSFLIIFSRRPDAILNSQFWAEDGVVWYAQAYQNGIFSLFAPELGYYGTVQRLVAVLSQPIPLKFVPLIFNLCAIGIQILIVQFFLSKRFSKIIPNLPARLLLTFVYLALPNCFEISSNLTNSQWHLALFAFLLLIAEPSEKIAWKIFDTVILVISVLSGPFCFFLFPIAVIHFWQTKKRWTLWLLLNIVFGCLAQGFSMLGNKRLPQSVLGVDFELFTRIAGGQVFVSSIVGAKGYSWLINHHIWNYSFAFAVTLAGFSFLIYAYLKVSPELKLFILYATFAFTAALIFPAASTTEPQWEILQIPFACVRYWFLPMLCFLTVLFYFAAQSKTRALQIASSALLMFALCGIVGDWKHPRFKDFEFQKYAQEFENAPSETEITIPVNPNWEMKLIKK